MMNFQWILKPIFHFIWRKRFWNGKLIEVTGWNSCIMDENNGQRTRATFLFSGNKDLDHFAGVFIHEVNTFTIRDRNRNDTTL